jgi:hypothetical protein
MQEDILEERQRVALSALKQAADRGFYLAGGTALCMHIGHRRSHDLDLFRTDPFDADELVRSLREVGVPLEDVTTSPATVHAAVEGVRTSLLRFPYPLLAQAELSRAGVPLASVRDIAAMKVEAIASRGARRDFYDLYFICQSGLSLVEVLRDFDEKFASSHPDRYHRIRAMTYFDDAEREPLPILLRPAEWKDVREFFERSVADLWGDR